MIQETYFDMEKKERKKRISESGKMILETDLGQSA